MKRLFFLTIGSVSFAIGTIGIYIPGLPTTVFYLMATYCLARSSEKYYQKITRSKHYQTYIHKPFVAKEITSQAKLRIFLSMGIVFLIGIFFSPSWVKWLLALIYLLHLIGLSWYWSKKK